MRPVKILYVAPQAGGGAIESLLQLILNLETTSYSTTVLFDGYADTVLRARLTSAGAHVINLQDADRAPSLSNDELDKPRIRRRIRQKVSPKAVRIYSELLSVWHLVRFVVPRAVRISRIMKSEMPDIVHVNSAPHDGLAGILAARLIGVPCVCHVRSMSNLSIAQKLLSRSVRKYIFISTEVQRHLNQQNIGTKNGEVVFNGVDIDEFQASRADNLRSDLGIAADTFLVGMVGRLDHWKGHDVFIEAVNQLTLAGGKIYALIIGTPQSSPRHKKYYDSLMKKVHEKQLDETVHFLGHRDDVPAIMSQLDLHVLASTQPEPFGRVVIEAMAAGTPVVATAAGGVLDIIHDGKNGILVPAGDAQAMAAAISWVEANARDVAAIVERAKMDVSQRFTSKRHANNVSEIYEELLSTDCCQ